MRYILGALAIFFGLSGAVQAQDAAIRRTIDGQLGAFQADDFETAFSFASPNIQRLFGSYENFRRMVTQGYPMVWRPGSVRYLDLRDEDNTLAQRVMITDQAGQSHLLEYRMVETDGGWRINGVRIIVGADVGV